MPSGTGLAAFHEKYPSRFFDVGIAEEYAVTFAAGMAASGMRPVIAIYSSFLQRAYDQILHDVCIQKLPVFFCVDRSGLVGADGETHQGIFDISYLGHLPNLVLMAPKNGAEIRDMMAFALQYEGPIAMKYPRGAAWQGLPEHRAPIELGRSEWIREGNRVVILAVGNIMEECAAAAELLAQAGVEPGLVNVRFVRPYDEEMLRKAAAEYDYIVTVEENELTGGFGQMVSAFYQRENIDANVLSLGIPDCFVEHSTVARQREQAGIDAASIARQITERMEVK
jgi:1-deoxy-D-xylulose-5-phosphate synthase